MIWSQNRVLEGQFGVGFDFLKLHPRGVVVNTQMDREQKKLLQNETPRDHYAAKLQKRRKWCCVVLSLPATKQSLILKCSRNTWSFQSRDPEGVVGGLAGDISWHTPRHSRYLSTDEYSSMQLITPKITSNSRLCFQCSLPNLLLDALRVTQSIFSCYNRAPQAV